MKQDISVWIANLIMIYNIALLINNCMFWWAGYETTYNGDYKWTKHESLKAIEHANCQRCYHHPCLGRCLASRLYIPIDQRLDL